MNTVNTGTGVYLDGTVRSTVVDINSSYSSSIDSCSNCQSVGVNSDINTMNLGIWLYTFAAFHAPSTFHFHVWFDLLLGDISWMFRSCSVEREIVTRGWCICVDFLCVV